MCVRGRLILSRPCVSSSESFTARSIPIAISSALPNVDLASERSLFLIAAFSFVSPQTSRSRRASSNAS